MGKLMFRLLAAMSVIAIVFPALADDVSVPASAIQGQPLGSTGFNDMLGKQIKPGIMAVEEQKDGSFLLTNKLQTVSAHVTASGTTFDSIGNSAGKGGFTLKLEQWGREPALQKVVSTSLYKKDGTVYHTHNNGLAEKFSNNSGGIQQDFVIATKPAGKGDLHLQLLVSGAQLQPKANGATILLKSGRKLTYDRLSVKDSAGKNIPAEIRVVANNHIDVMVNDATAKYPLIIDPTVGDENWVSMGGISGVNGRVFSIAIYNSDIYVAGIFTVAGNIMANNIAKWDGSTWSSLGSGIPGYNFYLYSFAMAIDSNGILYIGGAFSNVGGVSVHNIAKWDGTNWSAVGSFSQGEVFALAIDSNNKLYVGSQIPFSNGGAVDAWNGTSWTSIASSLDGYPYALAVDKNNNLYVGGSFHNINNLSVSCIAKWDGANWNQFGAVVEQGVIGFCNVSALSIDSKNNIYMGGSFTSVDAVSANNITEWNGSAWISLGEGSTQPVTHLIVDSNDNIYIVGTFQSDPVQEPIIAKWDGSAWISIGYPAAFDVNALAADNTGNVYVGGSELYDGNTTWLSISKWDGENWGALDKEINEAVNFIAEDVSGLIYIAGNFQTIGGVVANHIAKWDGSQWTALGSGLSDFPYAITLDKLGNVYAAGSFGILKWDGISWSSYGGAGVAGPVYSMIFNKDGDLVVGRLVVAPNSPVLDYVIEWNGTSWIPVGTSFDNHVRSLAMDSNGNLYAGGSFTHIGNAIVNHIAKWDGALWTPMGPGFNDGVLSLAVDSNNVLYAAGFFTSSGQVSVNYIAKWDGINWSPMAGGMSSYVLALGVDANNNIYAGGHFTITGSNTINNIAKWNGAAWLPLGSGTDNAVSSISINSNSLYAGGYFTVAGEKVSGYKAKWNINADIDGDGVIDDQDCYPTDNTMWSCSPGTYPTGSGYAIAPPGTYAYNGILLQCPAGTYNQNSASSSINSCVPTPPGSYSFPGAALPTVCPAGTNSYAGASSIDQCFADANADGLPDAIDASGLGSVNGDNTGRAVMLADMDGDGYADILVGSPYADKAILVNGKATILRDAGSIRIISGATGQVIRTLYGYVSRQRLGAAFAVVTDQNGDNIPDLVVGSPMADVSTSVGGKTVILKAAGNVSIYSGADGTLISSIANGAHAGDHFGASVAVGDVDADSVADLVVGAPLVDVATLSASASGIANDVGQVTVFSGISNTVLYTRTGSQAGEHFGASVAVDTNLHQLLVGSPGYDVTTQVAGKTLKLTDAGLVQVFAGADGTGSPLAVVPGQNKGDQFGAAVSSFSQDMDGDGYDDWAVGIPGFDISTLVNGKTVVLKDAGRVEFFSGTGTTPLAQHIDGANAGDNFGAAVSTSGDINKDGKNDIAIGSPKYDVHTTVNGKAVILKDAGRVEVFNSGKVF